MTRAEDFRSEQQRKGWNKKKKPSKPKATKEVAAASPAARNASKHGARKATVKLEESATGKPSRKSTRASANHQRAASVKERTVRGKLATPKSRHSTGTGTR